MRLRLFDFRNYQTLKIETEGRPVVLTGPNGAGKTNVLEALSFLAPGRGLRRAKLSEVARHGTPAWALAARIEGGSGPVEIGTGNEEGGERRIVRIDGEPARTQSALAEIVGLVWLTPSMDRMFGESAGGRRRFLDRLVLGIDPGHAARSARYERALRQRNRLLEEGGADPAWLAALEVSLAEDGIAIEAARRAYLVLLNQACRAGIGPFPAASLALSGSMEDWPVETDMDGARTRFRDVLAASRRDDSAGGGSRIGPHRSDLLVRHADKDMPARDCSTGEQKAVLIAIVLGHARVQAEERGRPPLMLWDEIAAHLDETRRAWLFDEMCALPGQSWLTGTDLSSFEAFAGRAQFFQVRDGALLAQ